MFEDLCCCRLLCMCAGAMARLDDIFKAVQPRCHGVMSTSTQLTVSGLRSEQREQSWMHVHTHSDCGTRLIWAPCSVRLTSFSKNQNHSCSARPQKGRGNHRLLEHGVGLAGNTMVRPRFLHTRPRFINRVFFSFIMVDIFLDTDRCI